MSSRAKREEKRKAKLAALAAWRGTPTPATASSTPAKVVSLAAAREKRDAAEEADLEARVVARWEGEPQP